MASDLGGRPFDTPEQKTIKLVYMSPELRGLANYQFDRGR